MCADGGRRVARHRKNRRLRETQMVVYSVGLRDDKLLPRPTQKIGLSVGILHCMGQVMLNEVRPKAEDFIQECLRHTPKSLEASSVKARKRSVKPVWTWERANRTRASSTASTGLCPCAGRAPGPDRLAVRRCLPDCRNTRYRQDRTLTKARAAKRIPKRP